MTSAIDDDKNDTEQQQQQNDEDERMSSCSVDDDARAYNLYASAAVDLSEAQHFLAPQEENNTGSDAYFSYFSVVRSVRDIDNNKRRRYLYTATLSSAAAAEATATAAATPGSLGKAIGQRASLTPPPPPPPTVLPMPPPVPLADDIQWRLVSPSGAKVAILVNAGKDDPPLQVLEIWTHGGHQLERSIALDKKRHGKVMNDAGGFGRPSWNAQETALVYAAERKAPETTSYFETNNNNGSDKKKSIRNRGGQYTLGLGKTETWGERYAKQSALLDLFCVDVTTGKCGRIQNVPGGSKKNKDDDADDIDNNTTLGGFSLGQAVWSPDGTSIVYTGWDAGGGQHMPRRLGMIYCQQRPCKLYCSSVVKLLKQLSTTNSISNSENVKDPEKKEEGEDKGYTVLTPDLWIAKSPRFSPPLENEKHCRLVFLATEKAFDTHSGCFGLHSLGWSIQDDKPLLDTARILVGQVWNPQNDKTSNAAVGKVSGLPFPGLFLAELPRNPFVSPDDLVTSTQWGSCQKMVRISLSTGRVQLVSFEKENNDSSSSDSGGDDDNQLEDHELLCVGQDGSAFVVVRSCTQPGTVWRIPNIALLEKQDKAAAPRPRVVMNFRPLASTKFSAVTGLPELDFDVTIQVLPELVKYNDVDSDLVVQSILMLPNKTKHPEPPLIVCPHGGPHSAYTTTYYHSLAFLCDHGGYALLITNYRGSTGFGQASVEALPTRIGDMDVNDVITATNQVRYSGLVDPARIGISGGSHGGFLVAHCTGQHPDLFKAASTRNPVVNLPSMITATDIPDWCLVEATGSQNWKEYRPATKEEIDIMYSCSPVKRVHQVKTPTLVALGLVDLRVPPSQGLEWYHTLRSMRVPTRLLTYPDDCHAIDGVAAEADFWIQTKQWFDKYLRDSCGGSVSSE